MPRAKPEYWFDERTATGVMNLFEHILVHTKGQWAGQHFVLQPWQKKIVRDVFGWKRRDGTRKYRQVYIEVPRKQGKSTLCAGMALALLFADSEPGAEVYSAAADREQASIVFEAAKAMVTGSQVLMEHAQIFRRTIVAPEIGGSYKVLSADVGTKHGLNAHGVIFDELHAQPNRDLWDVLTTSMGARRQPLLVAITTAGYDRESICWEQHEYARQILDGSIVDEAFYPVIYAADAGDDWKDPATWRKANPSLGVTVKAEFLDGEARKAAHMPGYQNTFRRLYLNQWTQQSERWIDMSLWDANAVEGGAENEAIERTVAGRPCYGGLDLSSVSDLTAWVMVFPRADDPEVIDVLCRFWCPEKRLQDGIGNKYAAQYRAWAAEGWLETTEGDAIDYGFVKQRVIADATRFGLIDMNIDRLFQGYQLAQELTDELGVQYGPDGPEPRVFGMGQGFYSMAAPMKELERRLLEHKVRHWGNPVLRWMADNVSTKTDPAGNVKPDKSTSNGKIDGVVALVMALDRAMRHNPGPSIYETRGVMVL